MIFKKLIFRTKKVDTGLVTSFSVDLAGNECEPNLSTVFSTNLYHNGVNAYPEEADLITYDYAQTSPVALEKFVSFVGGIKRGHVTDASGISIPFTCK